VGGGVSIIFWHVIVVAGKMELDEFSGLVATLNQNRKKR